MELRQYWYIIRTRFWIPVVLVLVVAAVSLGLQAVRPRPPLYTSEMRFAVGVKPEETPGQYHYDSYYAWLASEYLVDDFSVVVGSQAFARDVNTRLADGGSRLQLPPGVINGSTIAEKQHRILRVTVSWADPQELAQLTRALVTVIEQDSPKYFAQLGTPGALIRVIDEPSPPAPSPAPLTQRLDLPIRIILALIAGLGLTFLLDYLDTGVRNRAELEGLGIPVLAEIPKK
jgi:capsular polysaccharide biosynthesis protein